MFNRKFPNRADALEAFLLKLPYDFVQTPQKDVFLTDIQIRAPDDFPILSSAILAKADILITGDNDFDDVQIERPEILTPREFINKYS